MAYAYLESEFMTTFSDLGLIEPLLRALTAEGYSTPTPIQQQAIPLLLQGRGQWVGGRLRFAGDAQAAPGSELALTNLLNIVGRRDGPRSVITIG